MKMKLLVILCALSLTLAAQEKPAVVSPPKENEPTPEQILQNTIHVVAHDDDVFALQFYNIVRQGKNNFVFSPYGLSSALAMVYQGAAASTQSQMIRLVRFQVNVSALNSAFAWMITNYSKRSRSYEDLSINVSNSLWIVKGPPITPVFQSTLQDVYKSPLKRIDFVNKSGAAQEINSWMRDRTQGKIPLVVQPNDLVGPLKMLLVSGVYMRGKWATTFDPNYTKQVPYFLNSSTTTSVPMMTILGRFRHYKDSTFAMVELPYETKRDSKLRISMYILLPANTWGLDALEKGLNYEKLSDSLDKMELKTVLITIPKFSIASITNLREALTKFGLVDPFAEYADFSGIDETTDLKLGKVIQAAAISIDERGTDAGVAAGSVYNPNIPEGNAVNFLADHPFMFFVIDNDTGSILYIGRFIALNGDEQ